MRLKLAFSFLVGWIVVFTTPVFASQTTLYFGSTEKTLETGETKVYIPTVSSTVVKTIKSDGTSAISYLYSNHVGSTVLITKDSGTLDNSLEYYPYGEEITTISTNTDKLYTGQRKDTFSDLYFYNARYYNPQTSHFVSADKAEGPNRYAYVGNNPVMRNDPGGTREVETDKNLDQNLYDEAMKKNGSPINNLEQKYGIEIPQNNISSWGQKDLTKIQEQMERMIKVSHDPSMFEGITYQYDYETLSLADADPATKLIRFNKNYGSNSFNVLSHEFGHTIFGPMNGQNFKSNLI